MIPQHPTADAKPVPFWHKTTHKTNEVIRGAVTHTDGGINTIFFFTANDTAHVINLHNFTNILMPAESETSSERILHISESVDLMPTEAPPNADDILKIPHWNSGLIPLSHNAVICTANSGKNLYLVRFIGRDLKTKNNLHSVEVLQKKTIGASVFSQAIKNPRDDNSVIVAFLSDPAPLDMRLYLFTYSLVEHTYTITTQDVYNPEYLHDFRFNPPKFDKTRGEIPLRISISSSKIKDIYLHICYVHIVYVHNITIDKLCASLDIEYATGFVKDPLNDKVYIADARGVIFCAPYMFEPGQSTQFDHVATHMRPFNSTTFNILQAANLYFTGTHLVLLPHGQLAALIALGDCRKPESIEDYIEAIKLVTDEAKAEAAATRKQQTEPVDPLPAKPVVSDTPTDATPT